MVKSFDFVLAICLYNFLVQCLQGVNAVSACPSDWVQSGSSCYLFHDTGHTKKDSKTYCQDRGGAILRIESSQENDFIMDEMNSRRMSFVWIDCNAINTDELCYTADPTLTSYESWTTGNPTNQGDCAMLHGGNWYTTVCTEMKDIVCEINKPTNPTSTTSCYVLDDNGRLPLQDGNIF